MVRQNSELFRKEAIERASSPEDLDQIMQVVSPRKWLPLIAAGSLVAAGLIWSVMGRIPVTVTGNGILTYPSKTIPFQSPLAGKIQTVKVRVGDFVSTGDVLVTLDQRELFKQLQLELAKLEQLEQQDRDVDSVQTRRQNIEKQSIQQQRQTLLQSLQAVQQLTPILENKGLDAIRQDRANQQQALQSLQELLPTYRQRLKNRLELLKQGAIPGDTVLQSQQDYLNGIRQINEAQSQLKQLDLKEAQTQQQYLQNLNLIKNLQTQLRQLDSQEATVAEKDLEAQINRKKEVQQVRRNISQLILQSKNNSIIRSSHTGRILEISATPGQVVQQGTSLGEIAAQKQSAQIMTVAFFPVGKGKKIQPGMKLQITPSTVERERFGGIVGVVTDVSDVPVTKESALSVVGNANVVESLMSQGPQLQVTARLKPDISTFSGYKWSSSKGANLKVTSGTTASVQVTTEERAPISFVIPLLRSWTGAY